MKVKNKLLNFDGYYIFQDNDYFLFSLDSVLLANFVNIKLSTKKIIDFCSGNAAVPMLLSFRTKVKIDGVEIQKYIYDIGVESIKINKLDNQISLFNYDVRKVCDLFETNTYDIVTCNPPYFKYVESNYMNKSIGKSIARHEIMLNLEDVIRNGAYLLKENGSLVLVHRTERLTEIIDIMRKYKIEPKRIRLVYPFINKEANMVLIDGVKGGKNGLKIEKPLIIYDKVNVYSKEVLKMYGSE